MRDAGTARHVAVVDDEADVRATVAEYLETRGLRVSCADDGSGLRALFDGTDRPELVVLDLRMPGEDGLSLARWLRRDTSAGVIMLTALGDPVDRVVGLELGADDYVAKPVDLRELVARIHAVLRRLDAAAAAAIPPVPAAVDGLTVRRMPFGRVWLDLDQQKLVGADGADLPLTAMEFDLLKAFAENPNRVLTRDRLLDLAHKRDWEPFDRSIDVRIARIRRKIELDPAKPQVIKTIRGSGYLYAPPTPVRNGA
jgi:two-component system phosphate regulon response regulator OmpR